MTLEQILEKEQKSRQEKGMFGIEECKKHIVEIEIGLFKKDLYQLLGKYVKSANEDIFFNKAMVLACWELINER